MPTTSPLPPVPTLPPVAAPAPAVSPDARRSPLPALPTRPRICFARTPQGQAAIRLPANGLPLHVGRLLLLFEGPQTVEDLRQMIDEPWLPEAVIELERRGLIARVAPPPLPHPATPQAPVPVTPLLAARRVAVREQFLQQLGTLGAEMARRIEACTSPSELDELMPQVDALVEALAGRAARDRFRDGLERH